VAGQKQSADLEDVRVKLSELAAAGRSDELIALVLDLLVRVRDDNTALQVRLRAEVRQRGGSC